MKLKIICGFLSLSFFVTSMNFNFCLEKKNTLNKIERIECINREEDVSIESIVIKPVEIDYFNLVLNVPYSFNFSKKMILEHLL